MDRERIEAYADDAATVLMLANAKGLYPPKCGGVEVTDFIQLCRLALKGLEVESGGKVVVPREPTDKMMDIFNGTAFMNGRPKRALIRAVFHSAYRDMIEAAQEESK